MPKIKIDTSGGSIIWKIGKQNIWGCKLVSKKKHSYLFKVTKHKQLKNKLLKNIKDTPFTKTYQNVSQTDWEIDSFLKRKYWDKNIIDIFESCTDILKKEMYGPLSKKFKVIVDNYWFHIYKKNSDYQWHTHGHSNFSAIYYISLPEKKYKTKFLNMDIPVKEGDLLIFPSFLAHCSPINKSNKEKVVLSFNFSII